MKTSKRKFISVVLVLVMTFLALQAPVISVNNEVSSELDLTYISDINYISISDYIKKYGEQNIRQGFSEVQNIIENEYQTEMLNVNRLDSNEYSRYYDENYNLLDELLTGTFMGGIKILGISDLPPNDRSISLQLDDSAYFRSNSSQSKTNNIAQFETENTTTINSRALDSCTHNGAYFDKNISTTTPILFDNKVKWYYTSYNPTYTICSKWSGNEGALYIKNSLNFQNFWRTEANIEITPNTSIKFIRDKYNRFNNAYIYVTAQGSQGGWASMDFGLMTAVDKSGLYMFRYFTGIGNVVPSTWYAEGWPMVTGNCSYYKYNGGTPPVSLIPPKDSKDYVILSFPTSTTVSIHFSVNNGDLTLYAINNVTSRIYNYIFNGQGAPLGSITPNPKGIYFDKTNPNGKRDVTFSNAVGFLANYDSPDLDPSYDVNAFTPVDSGSYIKNIKFKDSKLNHINGSSSDKYFTFQGDNTYFTLFYGHPKITHAYSVNGREETISIIYN